MKSEIRNSKFEISLAIAGFLFSFFFITKASAAELYFGSNSKEFGIGNTFEIGVFLNTQGETINAIESKIDFATSSLEVTNIRDGNTLLNLWVDRPRTTPDGQVFFSGIIPGGYRGNKGYLFSIIFRAKENGRVNISTKQEHVLLNDGKGTEAKLVKAPIYIIVAKGFDQNYLPPYDAAKPDFFTPQITRDTNVYNGDLFASFATQDKSSGIDHYEILETKNPSISASVNWVDASSPYRLKDQSQESYIYMKAVDKAGNSRITIVQSPQIKPWYQKNVVSKSVYNGAQKVYAVFQTFIKIIWNVLASR